MNIWKSHSKHFEALGEDISCDTAIIGGGIAGLWCAYNLIRAGQKVIILEAKQIGHGVTSGSTAIMTYAQDIIYQPIIKKHGKEAAAKYLNDTKGAIRSIVQIVRENNFNIDLQPIDFVLFSTKCKGKCTLNKEIKAYKELDETIEIMRETELPYNIKKAVKFDGCYQFDPLKLCSELSSYIIKHGGQIFERTLVTEAPKEKKLKVGKHIITANNFIVATHFPYINAPGFYWLKMYQEQNYAITFKEPQSFKDFCKTTSYESIDETGFEYRRVGQYILIDGVSVRTGQKPYKSKYKILEKHISKHFGISSEDAEALSPRWCAQDCITMDKLPYAGRYSHFADNVFVVTGFNKWGMTNSFICARVATDMILGKILKDAPFEQNIYTPQRVALFVNLIETIGNVATIAGSFANNLLNLDAKKFERIKPGQGAVIKFKGHRVGASRDDKGKVHLISAICPHMGCDLKWNKDERTFDCPCHGSRFDCTGQIVNNPTTKPAERISPDSEVV